VNAKVLEESRRKKLTFDQAIEEKVFTIIGQGAIDFPGFFRILERNNYSGWMVVEQDVKFGATPVPPAVSIAASLKYLRGVVNQLAVAAAS
jgi:sugar phosphate isomerase/epimerase